MYYILSEIYIVWRFLKDSCNSQQIISTVAKEFLIPNLILEVLKPLILWHKVPAQINSNKCKIRLSFFWAAAFASRMYEQLKYV